MGLSKVDLEKLIAGELFEGLELERQTGQL